MNAKCLLLVVMIGISSNAYAQWSKVANQLLGQFPENCCGFGSVHFKDGMVWAGANELFVSADSGLTWSLTYDPPARITEINFFDRAHGIVSTLAGIDKTTDGGKTWTTILQSANCHGAQFAGNPLQMVAAVDTRGLFSSADGGMTWSIQPADAHTNLILGNDDGSAIGFSGSPVTARGRIFRKDRNASAWIPLADLDYDCFQAVRHPCSGKLFLMNEEGHILSDNRVSILASEDEGQTWDPVFIGGAPQFFSAGMSISPCCAIYCQTVRDGIVRSTDQGETWKKIGGPSNTIDTRTVCAITDNVVVAIDAEGSIWRTDNSGGDSLYPAKDVTLYHEGSVITPDGICHTVIVQARDNDAADAILSGMFDTSEVMLSDIRFEGVPLEFTITDSSFSVSVTAAMLIKGVEFTWCTRNTKAEFTSIQTYISSFCVGTQSDLSFTVQCGDDIIHQFMRSGTLPEFTIVENPAAVELLVSSDSYRGAASLRLVNTVGNVVRSREADFSSEQTIRVPIDDIPAGYYIVHLFAQGIRTTKAIVIVR